MEDLQESKISCHKSMEAWRKFCQRLQTLGATAFQRWGEKNVIYLSEESREGRRRGREGGGRDTVIPRKFLCTNKYFGNLKQRNLYNRKRGIRVTELNFLPATLIFLYATEYFSLQMCHKIFDFRVID